MISIGRWSNFSGQSCASFGTMQGVEPYLRTERLLLRRACQEDLEAFHAIFANQEAMHYWSTTAHTNVNQTATWLAKVINSSPEKSNEFVVEFEGRVIGKAGCWRLPEIGFIFDPAYWGRGLAHEALLAVIESTFTAFPIAELTADVDPRNHACRNLLKRLGFGVTGHAERTWSVNGKWADSVYLALPRSDFFKPISR